MDTLDKFLKDLTNLTKKYNIKIGGCGCCGSPYLYINEPYSDKIIATDLLFTENEYYINKR